MLKYPISGLLSGKRNIIVKSNDEVGIGRADIIVKNKAKRCVAIFELKKAKSEESMETFCDEALQQIERNKYHKRNIVTFGYW